MHGNPSAEFMNVQQAASCPFAARANIHAAEPYAGSDARAAGADALPQLVKFVAGIDIEELDGFLIELTDPMHGRNVDLLAATVRDVVTGLLETSGVCASEALSAAGEEDWWLTLLGTRWFALAFAPCYPRESPRSTLGASSTFVLLQPVASFDRHATPRGAVIPESARRAVQRAYAESGRPYEARLAMQDIESLKFVWPLPGEEDRPVSWWKQARTEETGPQ